MSSRSLHGVTDITLPHLYRPSQIAEALGCSEWWVKEQARRRRIPFTRLGGAYRFTAEHYVEIVGTFEERPVWGHEAPKDAVPLPAHRTEAVPKVQLQSRSPRRAKRSSPTADAA